MRVNGTFSLALELKCGGCWFVFRKGYEVHWTDNMGATKDLLGSVLDVSNGEIEWNVGPDLNNSKINQVCDEKMCTIEGI
jgi:hypothetical protein